MHVQRRRREHRKAKTIFSFGGIIQPSATTAFFFRQEGRRFGRKTVEFVVANVVGLGLDFIRWQAIPQASGTQTG